MRYSSLAAVLIGLFTTISAIDPVEVVGSKFFNKDGSQFYLKGNHHPSCHSELGGN